MARVPFDGAGDACVEVEKIDRPKDVENMVRTSTIAMRGGCTATREVCKSQGLSSARLFQGCTKKVLGKGREISDMKARHH